MTLAAYRDATPADRTFIRSTWSSSYKAANAAGMIASEDWADVMHRQVDKLLDRSDVRAIVAFERADPTFLYGFIAGDTSSAVPIVFYVYVKEPYREAGRADGKRVGDGHARGLFRALGVDPREPFLYACRTAVVTRLVDKIPRARWDPNVARYPKNQKETR